MDEEKDFERFEAPSTGITFHNNSNLQCRNCEYRLQAVRNCEKFKRKPDKVLTNEGRCPEYKKESLLKAVKRWFY